MNLNHIINQIRQKQQQNSTISQSLAGRYKCPKCKDTGWCLTENGNYEKCECIELDYMKRLWQHFGVKPEKVKKLDDYEPFDKLTASAKEKAVDYLNNFEEIKDSEENSYGLFGQPGSGKTHIVIAIGAALLKQRVPVVYMPYLEAMRELKANVNDDEYYLKLSSRYCNAKLLVIDDLFKDKVRNGNLIKGAVLSEPDIKHILPIINFRYFNNLPTVYSSECTPQMLLNLDEANAGRILERCESHMVIFKGSQYNYRMKKFMKAQ